jgi:hypothetical protein
MEGETMTDEESYQEFLRQRRRHEQVLDRFDQQLTAYCREHPDADVPEVRAYAELLEAAIPGVKEAIRASCLEAEIAAALVADRGDGLPVSGPSAERDDDGERVWKLPELWTVDDYCLTLAWYREPDAPAAQLAALIAYGESRWPGEDFSRGPWPDTSDLPAWEELARSLTDDEDDEEDLTDA